MAEKGKPLVNPVTLMDRDTRAPIPIPIPVAIQESEATIQLTGDVVLDSFGAVDDTKETDPDAAEATIPALLRGILAEMQAQTALLTTIAANTAE